MGSSQSDPPRLKETNATVDAMSKEYDDVLTNQPVVIDNVSALSVSPASPSDAYSVLRRGFLHYLLAHEGVLPRPKLAGAQPHTRCLHRGRDQVRVAAASFVSPRF